MPESWKRGHTIIRKYLAKSVPDRPDQFEQIQPLYRAVVHACRAGDYEEAWHELLMPRIRRGFEHYPGHVLGRWNYDLDVLSYFFEMTSEKPFWTQPVHGLEASTKAQLLNEVGYDLRALGRLSEARTALERSLRDATTHELWDIAATASGNLSKVCKPLGELRDAECFARSAVEFADKSAMKVWMMASRAWLGDILHQRGRLGESGERFREAEAIQQELRQDMPLLPNTTGFRYCDLLLDLAEGLASGWFVSGEVGREHKGMRSDQSCSKVDPRQAALELCRGARARALQTLSWLGSDQPKGVQQNLFIGIDQVTLGRAKILELRLSGSLQFDEAAEYTWKAVETLRQAGDQTYFPRGLFCHSQVLREQRKFGEAGRFIEEAKEVADRCTMRLYQVDCELEYARLHLARETPRRLPSALIRQPTWSNGLAITAVIETLRSWSKVSSEDAFMLRKTTPLPGRLGNHRTSSDKPL